MTIRSMRRPFDAPGEPSESHDGPEEAWTGPSPAQISALEASDNKPDLPCPRPVAESEVADGSPPETFGAPEASEDGDHLPLEAQEVKHFSDDTIKAFLGAVLELWAHAQGFGPALKVAELTWKAGQWFQVGQDEREVNADVPIPLGGGVELDLSLHLGTKRVEDEPLVTLYCAPARTPLVGELDIRGLVVSPGEQYENSKDSPPSRTPDHPPAASDLPATASEHVTRRVGPRGRIAVTTTDLMARERDQTPPVAGRPRAAASGDLPVRLRRGRRKLREAGVDVVVVTDITSRVVLWVSCAEDGEQSPRVRIVLDDAARLRIHPNQDEPPAGPLRST